VEDLNSTTTPENMRAGVLPIIERIAVALALAFSLSVSASCQNHVHVQYVGTIDRAAPDARSAALTLNVWSSTDSTLNGYMTIAAPIGRSGRMFGWIEKDSLELLSASETGDSIRWYSSRMGARLTGTYEVFAGAGRGQTGRWSVMLAHGTALSPAGTPPAASISSLRSDWAGWLLLVATVLAFAWGFRRIWNLTSRGHVEWTFPITDAEARLRGPGGWMAWFLFAQLFAFLLTLTRASHIWTNVTGVSWLMGEIVPGLRPMLAMESLAKLAALTLPIVAVVLTTRLDRRARPWWMLLLALDFAYAAADIFLGERLREALPLVVGAQSGQRSSDAIDTARTTNLEVLLGSAIWFWYWFRSRRVRLNFGPIADERQSKPETAAA
jgi:hypothetical protein